MARATELGLISGTIDSLKSGETGWIEFQFRVGSDLDASLLRLIPDNDSQPLDIAMKEAFVDAFSVPHFSGDKVEVRSMGYQAIRVRNSE